MPDLNLSFAPTLAPTPVLSTMAREARRRRTFAIVTHPNNSL